MNQREPFRWRAHTQKRGADVWASVSTDLTLNARTPYGLLGLRVNATVHTSPPRAFPPMLSLAKELGEHPVSAGGHRPHRPSTERATIR